MPWLHLTGLTFTFNLRHYLVNATTFRCLLTCLISLLTPSPVHFTDHYFTCRPHHHHHFTASSSYHPHWLHSLHFTTFRTVHFRAPFDRQASLQASLLASGFNFQVPTLLLTPVPPSALTSSSPSPGSLHLDLSSSGPTSLHSPYHLPGHRVTHYYRHWLET